MLVCRDAYSVITAAPKVIEPPGVNFCCLPHRSLLKAATSTDLVQTLCLVKDNCTGLTDYGPSTLMILLPAGSLQKHGVKTCSKIRLAFIPNGPKPSDNSCSVGGLEKEKLNVHILGNLPHEAALSCSCIKLYPKVNPYTHPYLMHT